MGPTTTCVSMNSLKSTPVATPCTPRRLSLAESFTNLRDSTKTMSTSLGLVRLLQERGISAAVYNPRSWDRADSPLLNPCVPRADVLPYTPPNSPTTQHQTGPPFEFRGSSPSYDNFLASKPASSILKEVRAESTSSCNSECQTDVSVYNLNLVDKLKRFGIAKVVSPGGPVQSPPLTDMPRPFLSGAHRSVPSFGPGDLGKEDLPLVSPVVVTSTIGGLQLNAGMRRNHSFPVMVGASMQMKGPVPQSSGMLTGPKLPEQTSLR
ncbi:TRAK1 protein, partial [Polyodon spathula]|nr:TRAK1 protein [Polyodon spathula]